MTPHLALDNIRHLQVETFTLGEDPPALSTPLALDSLTLYDHSSDNPNPDREDFSLPSLALFNPITIHLFQSPDQQHASLTSVYLHPSGSLRGWDRLSHVFVHDFYLEDIETTESLIFQSAPSPPHRAGRLSVRWTVEASPTQSMHQRISWILDWNYETPRLDDCWVGSVSLVFESAADLEASRAHLEKQLAKVDESWRSLISCEVPA